MTIDEIQLYFEEHFFVERLTFNAKNKKLIKDFKVPKKGYDLGKYLYEKAWNDDLEGKRKSILLKMIKTF